MNMRRKRISIEALERIDDRCAEFERKWRENDSPSIESALADEVEREVLLAELIVLDLDYRRRRGETPTEQEYLDRFPDDVDLIGSAWKESVKSSGVFEPPSLQRVAELFPTLRILELIGAGGMGAVYKARQEGLDRIVALKILPEEFGHDVKFALRFTREARTLARLNHPKIVSVYEFGHVDDTYFFLMEYVEGSTLRDVVATGELAPEQALAIVPHLCDALQYAHDQGVIHRDIKPENILMSIDGTVKIADFGLSRIVGSDGQDPALTATRQVMGTPRYMAPEQFEGARGVDHRADIYSLGVVIYEMLTGELPIGRFEAPSMKTEVDVRIDEVVLRTLEREPRRRYQRASEVKSDVLSITSSTDASSPRSEPAATMVQAGADNHSSAATAAAKTASLAEQEVAGRLLLTRHQLMRRVENSLRPLFRKQILQIVFGIALIAIGAQCWARNTGVPHRLVSGVIVHAYGVIVIGCSIAVMTRIKRIDYSKSVAEVREKLEIVRSIYLGVSPALGFPWWLLWIPSAVAIGLDLVMHPNSLVVSLVVGVIGLVVSLWLYLRALKPDRPSSQHWRTQLSGGSLTAASIALDEIEAAQIS